MKVFEAILALLVLIMAMPMLNPAKTNENGTIIRYLITEDVFNVLYNKYGIAMFYSSAPLVVADLYLIDTLTGNCFEYVALFIPLKSCNPSDEKISVNYESIGGNVTLSMTK